MNITQYNITNKEYLDIIKYLELLHVRNCLQDIIGIEASLVLKDEKIIKLEYHTDKWVIIEDLENKSFTKNLK